MVRYIILGLMGLINMPCFGMQQLFSVANQRVYHDQLVLTDHNRAGGQSSSLSNGISLNVSYNNYHGAQRGLSIDQRLTSLKNQLDRIPSGSSNYCSQLQVFSSEIESVISSFKALVPQRIETTSALQIHKGILNLQHLSVSYHLQDYVNDALRQIKPIIAQSDGTLKTSLTKSEIKQLNTLVTELQAKLNSWYKYYGKLISAEMVVSAHNSGSLIMCSGGSPTQFNQIFEDVLNKNNFTEIQQIQTLCSQGLYAEAFGIINKCLSESHQKIMLGMYENAFIQNYNEKGIDKRFLFDHTAQELSAVLEKSQIPSIHNIELESRYTQVLKILGASNIKNVSPEMVTFVYQIVDKQALGVHEAIDLITTTLSKDNCDVSKRILYNTLCLTNGLPKYLNYSPEVARAHFPEAIHSSAYAQERALLAKVGLINTRNTEAKVQVERFVRYMQKGCSDSKYALAYKIYAQELGAQLLENGDSFLIHLSDFSIPAPTQFQDEIRENILGFFAQHIQDMRGATDSNQKNYQMLERMSVAYDQMIKGDFQAQLILEQVFTSQCLPEILNLDLTKLAEPAFLEQPALLRSCIEDIAQALHDMKHNGMKDSSLQYAIDPKTGIFMWKERKLSLVEYSNVKGNQLDHAFHRTTLANFKYAAELHSKGFSASRQSLFEIANRSNELVRSFVKIRDYTTAMNLSVFAQRTLVYIREAGLGSVQGVIDGVANVIHMVEHPWQSIYHIITAMGSLADRAFKGCETLLLDVPPSQTFQYAREWIKDTTRKIKNHAAELGVRGVSREISQFATEVALLNELGSLVGKAGVAISEEAALVANEISGLQKTESLVATTAEGIEIRAAVEASETAVFKESSRNAAMASGEVYREMILPKMQTYEQARNKALEIIGEVNPHSGKPYLGKFDIFKDKVVGRSWHNGKVVVRLDWDPIKGLHINVTDFRLGKGSKGTVVAIPFEGTLETAASMLKHLNK